jgi:hypothetical protein
MTTGQQKKPPFLGERITEVLAESLCQSDVFVTRMFLGIMLVPCWFPLLATLLAGKSDFVSKPDPMLAEETSSGAVVAINSAAPESRNSTRLHRPARVS